jgi:NIMA (never in mitosis gene a)-related kinase 1/4/5
MLAKLNHPFIIRHHDSFMADNDILHILMDYAAGGTIYHTARKLPAERLDEDRIWKHAIQTIVGLNYIHSQRIIHRDIKSLNLFLDENDNVKIGDFGIARALGDNTDMLRTIVGTPFYLSPELCEDKPYGEKSDVWAVGICLVSCLVSRPSCVKTTNIPGVPQLVLWCDL